MKSDKKLNKSNTLSLNSDYSAVSALCVVVVVRCWTFGDTHIPGIAYLGSDHLHDQCHSNVGHDAGVETEVVAPEIDPLLRGDMEAGDMLDFEAIGN
ncbi:MAG: hypothetical protein QM762_13850 [Chryseolinea sp.]